MKFTLAIIPAFFALSAFGSPVELNARQMPMCDIANCISTIATLPPAILTALPDVVVDRCLEAAGALFEIQQAQGMPPSQNKQLRFAADSLRCILTIIETGSAIPAECNSCVGAPLSDFGFPS